MSVGYVLAGFAIMLALMLLGLPIAAAMAAVGIVGGMLAYGLPFMNSIAPVVWGVHNDNLLTVDLTTRTVTAATTVGQNPDVLAYDPGAHRLVVAAESGIVATFDLQGQTLTGAGPEFLAEDAHVVAVDPATHRSYYPIPHGRDGHPAVLIVESH